MFHDFALRSRWARAWLPAAFALLAAACSAPDADKTQDTRSSRVSQNFLPVAGSVDHVGSAVCSQCHQDAFRNWQGSHHDLAMQVATPAIVLGDFDGTRFEYAGTTSTFSRKENRYFVETDGADGKLATFEIRYTFGHFPLQQYLIELPGGRLQAFGIAWDSRAADAGGQRWFHLYPDQKITAGHRLHWTGRDQNWNFMCADCHSTALAKNYDTKNDRYDTQWAEIDVSCEACHGPGLAHSQWAAQGSDPLNASKGLTVLFHERRNVNWMPLADSGFSIRDRPRTSQIEIDTCGRCHGRASRLLADTIHGGALLDTFRPALLDADQYWPDGQMRGEVFNWGPFLQSRMYRAGVTCSDCHEPHSLQLRDTGNALCARCHSSQRFDRQEHTGHAADSSGSQCVACHMPVTTFMQVDNRHDHAFRIPRPDLSEQLGTPNACTACHKEHSAAWAAAQLQAWFPESRHRGDHFGIALHNAQRSAPGAGTHLSKLISDQNQAGIVRASALRSFEPWLDARTLHSTSHALHDADALVRMASIELLTALPPIQRTSLLSESLTDPVRGIRIEAAAALAGASESALSPETRVAFGNALSEYENSLEFNSDRADTLVSLAELQRRRGNAEMAQQTYRRALAMEPYSISAALGLADLLRERGNENETELELRRALSLQSSAAELHHSLGLSLIRQRRHDEALEHLQRAAEQAPEQARFSYVLAIALNDRGSPSQAIATLNAALTLHPDDRDLLHAAAIYEMESGNLRAAVALVRRLISVDPENNQARDLLRWLEQQ
jgi:predicted CXXCH cytochrome family protein